MAARATDANVVPVRVGTTVDEAERMLILRTLESTGQNKTRAAEILGVSLKTLHNKLKEYSHSREDPTRHERRRQRSDKLKLLLRDAIGLEQPYETMRLKTKLVLAITGLVFLIAGLLSLVYVSHLVDAAIQQSYDSNRMIANQVRYCVAECAGDGAERSDGRPQR